MGHDATVVINMDAVDQIRKDPEFGNKVYDACCKVGRNKPVSISSGAYNSAAVAVDCHHADWHQVMIIGGVVQLSVMLVQTGNKMKQMMMFSLEL